MVVSWVLPNRFCDTFIVIFQDVHCLAGKIHCLKHKSFLEREIRVTCSKCILTYVALKSICLERPTLFFLKIMFCDVKRIK